TLIYTFQQFLASALVLVPLPWHWRARNTTTLSMLAWLFASNLQYAINSIIWAGRTDNVVPVWCDIVTKMDIGATAALPACCLALALQLWRVSSSPHTTNKQMVLMVDLGLCWVFPLTIMALRELSNLALTSNSHRDSDYVVQGHRFDIIEDTVSRVTRTPIDIEICSMSRVTRRFGKWSQNADKFVDKKSAWTTRRYLRVMVVTFILATWEAAVMGLVYGLTFSGPLEPYTSWADVHLGFSRVD
ncbi:GPCR fungal pheromone mating factor, partial [Mycena vitilis]